MSFYLSNYARKNALKMLIAILIFLFCSLFDMSISRQLKKAIANTHSDSIDINPSVTSLMQNCIGKDTNNFKIFIVKKAWHTGIIIKLDSVALEELPPLRDFVAYKFVDIGWGDEEFYQHPGFDALLAAKAIFMPTNSVIRIEGYSDLKTIYSESDFFVELELTSHQFVKLCKFILSSFKNSSFSTLRKTIDSSKLDSGKLKFSMYSYNVIPIITSKRLGGKIIYYKSNLKYHIFYTCNSWVARCLSYSNINISGDLIITAERLFVEIRKIGIVYKYKE